MAVIRNLMIFAKKLFEKIKKSPVMEYWVMENQIKNYIL